MSELYRQIAEALAPRPVQAWPGVVSVDAVAQQWARAGANHGSVVVAGHQASPRGHQGRPWTLADGDVSLSMVVRTDLPPEHEGVLYLAGLLAVSDGCGGTAIDWPDRVGQPGAPGDRNPGTEHGGLAAGAIAVHTELGPNRIAFGVVTALLRQPETPVEAATTLVAAIEHHLESPADDLAGRAQDRCRTLGHPVVARLVPLGPAGVVVEGTAVDLAADGALVIETAAQARVAVRPGHLALLETAG